MKSIKRPAMSQGRETQIIKDAKVTIFKSLILKKPIIFQK